MIARTWRGVVRAEDAAAYTRYVDLTGGSAFRKTPGFNGSWILTRTVGEEAVVLVLSLWESLDAVRAFAGDDATRAVFFPEDERFLLDRDLEVVHWEIGAHCPAPEPVGRS